jgi:S1-C subfamily serine protease
MLASRSRFQYAALSIGTVLVMSIGPGRAQTLRETFKRVSSSVAVIDSKRPGATGHAMAEDYEESIGSGFLISPDGKLLTAAHLVQVAEEVSVKFPQSEGVHARVVASEPTVDVALLQLEYVPPGATVVKLGDSDQMEVGDEVFIVGAPLGISQTMSYGHVSGIRKPHRVFGDLSTEEEELLQTDASINAGDSGGPMFNLAGEAVGVVSFGFGESEGAKGLNFVVTSNTARRLLLEQKPFWSGFEGYQLRNALAAAFNLPQSEGILVQRVAAGSTAKKLGLRAGNIEATIEDEPVLLGGDIVLKIAGVQVGDKQFAEKLRQAVARQGAGQMISVTVLRGGKTLQLQAASLSETDR